MKGLRARLLEQAASDAADDADSWIARDYYQSVIDSVASVICTVDLNLRVTGVNRRWDDFAGEILGESFTGEYILGVNLLDLMKGAVLRRWKEICPKILRGQMPLYLDEVICNQQVTWRHFTLAACPLKDRQGNILGITFVATNISQLKKAETEMLKRLVEIRGLRQVTQVAGGWFDRRAFHKQLTADIAHVFGAEKCILFRWGEDSGQLQAQAPAYGVSGRELIDLTLDIGDPDDRGSLWQEMEEQDYILLNEGDKVPNGMAETSARVDQLAAMMGVLRVSGRIHGIILVAGRDRPFTDQDGQLMAMLTVPIVLSIEDAELNRRLLARVHQLAAARDELARMTKIAESIRMPLTVVRGYMELLADGALGTVSKDQVSTLKMLVEKTGEIASAVDHLLPSQPLSGSDEDERINLEDIIRRVCSRRIADAQLAGLNLVIQPSLTGSEQQYITIGNRDSLIQAFDALLNTAVRSSTGSGVIYVSLHESHKIFYVKVGYPGSSPPAHETGDVWQSQENIGTGAASLAVAKRIIEEHSGQVWSQTPEDHDGAFYVVLPKIGIE
jgi:PAS domain S-box-containing protein